MAKGEESAYRDFCDAYCDRLSRYLLVVASGDEDAMREALQGTLLRVARHVRVFPDDEVFWSWLTVVARSALFDDGRRRRRYLDVLDRFALLVRPEIRPSVDAPSGDSIEGVLTRHVGMLPPDDRALVERKYFENLSVREIAAELRITEKAVESRLTRVRARLKESVLTELKDESHG